MSREGRRMHRMFRRLTDLKKARPALEVVAEVFGEHASAELRRGRGRPPKDARKVNQTLRIDADVLEAYRQEGKGWQRRIDEVLRQHMPQRPRSE
jgi:uncharacterized protein (DUF4415 family)